MNDMTYYICSAVLVIVVLAGIHLMSKPRLSVNGNLLSVAAVVCALVLTAVNYQMKDLAVFVALAAGGLLGLWLAVKTQMISMPQVVALLNGFGGLASALVALATFSLPVGFANKNGNLTFSVIAAGVSLFIGALTFSGSLVAAGKLARVLDAKPKKVAGHNILTGLLLVCIVAGIVMSCVSQNEALITHPAGVSNMTLLYVSGIALFSLLLGALFVMRVGGADMPITISLLNSFSGVAGGIAGMAVGEPLLVCVGGVVGASGLILTQDMCKAMNRSLMTILTGATTMSGGVTKTENAATLIGHMSGPEGEQVGIESQVNGTGVVIGNADGNYSSGDIAESENSILRERHHNDLEISNQNPASSFTENIDEEISNQENNSLSKEGKDSKSGSEASASTLTKESAIAALKAAKKVILVPGYGMALSQAQMNVAKLSEALEKNGAEVKFAIHPVAGRMPGHMSVLLCEADIPYEKLCMMEDINSEFASCDAAVVIGANDVTNPAANTAEGTPIYGMPVLNVADAPLTIICNFDLKPGYAGVDNPLYTAPTTCLMLGDAKKSVDKLYSEIS